MPRRVMQGTVVNVAGDKTVIVRVDRRIMHPLYKKFILRSKKYAVHDEQNRCKPGDVVRIRESRPYSKRKTWEVVADAA
ncbi:MAG: 30S ribosomal protein S17 [Alphaproteobacteria bacterium]